LKDDGGGVLHLQEEQKMKVRMNRFYQMDCIDFMRSLPAQSVNLVLTDPPYGVGYAGNRFFDDSIGYVAGNLDKWFGEMYRVLKDGAHIYVFVPTVNIDIFVGVVKKYFRLDTILPVRLKSSCMEQDGCYKRDAQFVIHASKGSPVAFNEVDIQPYSDAWRNDPRNTDPNPFTYHYSSFPLPRANAHRKNHPNAKNVELIKEWILLTTNECDVVLDPFCGGASTARAAIETGRNYYTCDLVDYGVLPVARIGKRSKVDIEEAA